MITSVDTVYRICSQMMLVKVWRKKHKYKTYVFILENNQACNVSYNGPQEKLFAFVDLKHKLWCKLALNGDFFIGIEINDIWDDLDLCFCVHDTWISGSHIWGTKFVEPIKLPEFECQSQLEYLSSSEMFLRIDALKWFSSLSLSKISFVTRRFPCWMSVIDDDSALLKIFWLDVHMNISLKLQRSRRSLVELENKIVKKWYMVWCPWCN